MFLGDIGRFWLGVLVAGLFPGAATATSVRELTFADRVHAQEMIERVYYAHQLGAKKPFEQAEPREVLETKVRRYLAESVALERLWNTPVTDEMLDRELLRIARDTRFPERLREVYAALGHDPILVKECFVRPVVVERLVRGFRGDGASGSVEWDSWLASGAASFDSTRVGTVARNGRAAAAGIGRGTAVVSDGRFVEHHGLDARLAPDSREPVWTGSEMIVTGFHTGGRYDPVIDVWTATSTVGAPDTSSGRAIWTGTERIFWGSDASHSGRYDPLTDVWQSISGAGAPSFRVRHSVVWTGSRMIVWGGGSDPFQPLFLNDGKAYDPTTDTWSPISSMGAPSGRWNHRAFWTGSEMIIWGGATNHVTLTGGRYNPASDSWSSMPTTNSWEASGASAVWSGTKMIVWGGTSDTAPTTFYDFGAVYDRQANAWTQTSRSGAPSPRYGHVAVWTGTRMFVWGGQTFSALNDGRLYDPSTNTWSPCPKRALLRPPS